MMVIAPHRPGIEPVTTEPVLQSQRMVFRIPADATSFASLPG